ncbi:MAG TPA: WYL domain-containing protein [Actinomycetota bacterium]|nr:WYL domain-containing protein [Actinomycetota bacterium]
MPVRKSERLLNLIVMLLETSQPVTAEQIHRTIPGYGQDSWDSFKRMFERDKEELREMGIPVELSSLDPWDTEQGYRIPKDRYYLPDLELEPDELAALWLAAGLLRMTDPGPARTALMKLTEGEPPPPGGNLSWLTADLGLAAPHLSVALESVAAKKKVTFAYRSKDRVGTRQVDPYGLSHRRGKWYLVGRDDRSGEVRSFRLDRVEGTIRLTHPSRPGPEFEIPEDFVLQGYVDRPPFMQGAVPEKAKVRFDPSTAWWVERSSPWLRLDYSDDGSAVAEVEVTDDSGFVSWLLWFGEGAEVLEPQHLRDLTRQRLEAIVG